VYIISRGRYLSCSHSTFNKIYLYGTMFELPILPEMKAIQCQRTFTVLYTNHTRILFGGKEKKYSNNNYLPSYNFTFQLLFYDLCSRNIKFFRTNHIFVKKYNTGNA